MFQFTDYIDPLWFFIALGVGLFISYIYAPPKRIVIKWPTPENAGKVIYKDEADVCYKYKAQEVTCPDNPDEIKRINIQHSEPEEKKGLFDQMKGLLHQTSS